MRSRSFDIKSFSLSFAVAGSCLGACFGFFLFFFFCASSPPFVAFARAFNRAFNADIISWGGGVFSFFLRFLPPPSFFKDLPFRIASNNALRPPPLAAGFEVFFATGAVAGAGAAGAGAAAGGGAAVVGAAGGAADGALGGGAIA